MQAFTEEGMTVHNLIFENTRLLYKCRLFHCVISKVRTLKFKGVKDFVQVKRKKLGPEFKSYCFYGQATYNEFCFNPLNLHWVSQVIKVLSALLQPVILSNYYISIDLIPLWQNEECRLHD